MRIILILALVAISSVARGQERLVMYPSFGGAHYEYEKDTAVYQVTPKQVSQILFDHPAAHAEFKKARTHSTLSGILGFLGAGLVVIPTMTAIIGGEPEWGLAAGGAALIAVSIPLSISYRKKAQHAITLFNERHASFHPRTQFYIGATRAGVVIRF